MMKKNKSLDKDQIYCDAFESLKHHDQAPNIAPPFDEFKMEKHEVSGTTLSPGFQFQYRRASAFSGADKAVVPIVGTVPLSPHAPKAVTYHEPAVM